MKYKYTREELAAGVLKYFNGKTRRQFLKMLLEPAEEPLEIDNATDLIIRLGEIKKILLEIKEPAEWPQEGDEFWFLDMTDTDGIRVCHFPFIKGLHDKTLKDGNCFRTEKQAIKARDKIKNLLKETK